MDGSLGRQQGGIGLGLSLVKRLVELLDGSITVGGEQGRGAVFRVSLPVSMPGDRDAESGS